MVINKAVVAIFNSLTFNRTFCGKDCVPCTLNLLLVHGNLGGMHDITKKYGIPYIGA